jgi:phenylacetate-CoA ligase
LPVLTRDMLMEYFDELVTDRRVRLADVETHVTSMRGGERFEGRYWINVTSARTGQPDILLFNQSEWAAIMAAHSRARRWAGIHLDLARQVRYALITSTHPWNISTQVRTTMPSWWSPTLFLDAGTPIATMVEQLNAWQPEVLTAKPSVLHRLADEQRAGRLCISPKRMFTGSEMLTGAVRQRIEAVWGRALFDQYTATMAGVIAAECATHRGLHILEDLVILEVVDEHNRPVPLGEEGDKVLITTLFSRTMPLIRYELHDRVRLAMKPCPCGRPLALIETVQGHTEDVLAFPTNAERTITVDPHVFHELMDVVLADRWQIVHEPAQVEVLLSGIRDEFDDTALAESLRRALAASGASVPPLSIRRVPAIPKSAPGKVLLVNSRATACGRTGWFQSLPKEVPHG